MTTEQTSFDVDEFIGSTKVEGGFSTQVAQCPEGTYRMQISSRDQWKGNIVNTQRGEQRVLRIPFKVLDDAVKAELERDTVLVSKDFWLDLDESGALDTSKGKNIDLGRLREALGQNEQADWTFDSLPDQLVMGKVVHRADKNDPEKKYAEVQKFAPIA